MGVGEIELRWVTFTDRVELQFRQCTHFLGHGYKYWTPWKKVPTVKAGTESNSPISEPFPDESGEPE